MNFLERFRFASGVAEAKVVADLSGVGLVGTKKSVMQAMSQAALNPGVLVKIGCGTPEEFSESLDLVDGVAKGMGMLVNEKQLFEWNCRFLRLAGDSDELIRMVEKGLEFDLNNGSGVCVYVDPKVMAMRLPDSEGYERRAAK